MEGANVMVIGFVISHDRNVQIRDLEFVMNHWWASHRKGFE